MKRLVGILVLVPFLFGFTISPKVLIKNKEANANKEVEVLGVIKSVEILKSLSGAYDYILIELYDDVTIVAYKEKIPEHTKFYFQDLVKAKGTFSLSTFFAGREFKRVIISDHLVRIPTS